MNIIHIYGASGSGTTTIGKAIAEEYRYRHLDTDDYFWLPTNPPFTDIRDVNERIHLMKKDMKDYEKIVITGSLCGWGDEFIPMFHLAVRIVTQQEIRIKRLHEREYQRFGERIRLHGDMYEEHLKFIDWAKQYDTGDENMRSKAMHDKWSSQLTCEQITLDGTKPVKENMNILKPYL